MVVVILPVCLSIRPSVRHTHGLLLALCTLSALPNDVMFKIQCQQLHNELFGCTHSILQSHSLFALAKLMCWMGVMGVMKDKNSVSGISEGFLKAF